MENTNLMIFICLMAPLSMMLLVFKERSRTILGFMLLGIFMCLFAGEINGLISNNTKLAIDYIEINIAPLVEEFLKALPIVFVAFLIKPDKQLLLECSIATGVGFATMENACLLFDSAEFFSIGIFLARGFGAGMMHGVCTFIVGYSMIIASSDRKLSYTGTIAALSMAIIYHSIYNILVLSNYQYLGVLFPITTYIPLVILINKKQKETK